MFLVCSAHRDEYHVSLISGSNTPLTTRNDTQHHLHKILGVRGISTVCFVALPCVHIVVYTSGGETETETNRDSISLQDMELSLSIHKRNRNNSPRRPLNRKAYLCISNLIPPRADYTYVLLGSVFGLYVL